MRQKESGFLVTLLFLDGIVLLCLTNWELDAKHCTVPPTRSVIAKKPAVLVVGVASSMGMEVLLVDGVWNERNWSVECGTARLED